MSRKRAIGCGFLNNLLKTYLENARLLIFLKTNKFRDIERFIVTFKRKFANEGRIGRFIVTFKGKFENEGLIGRSNVTFKRKITNEEHIECSNVPFKMKIANEGHIRRFIVTFKSKIGLSPYNCVKRKSHINSMVQCF